MRRQQTNPGMEPLNAEHAYIKQLMDGVANRDMSAQEVDHYNRQEPAYVCSETFVIVTLNQREINVQDGCTRQVGKSDWCKYLERPNETDMSLYQYCQHYDFDKYCKLRKTRIPRILPKIKVSGPEDRRFEEFCQVNLMTYKPASLQHPVKNEEHTWSQALREYASLPGSYVPEKVRDVIFGVEQQNSDDSSVTSEFEMSEDEDPEQPDFVLAGYRRQLSANMEDRIPLDPHAC